MYKTDLDEYFEVPSTSKIHLPLVRYLLRQMSMDDSKIILLGYTDIALHLINLYDGPASIIAIADNDSRKHGWSFRGIPVVSLDQALEMGAGNFVCCSVNSGTSLMGELITHDSYTNQLLTYHPISGPTKFPSKVQPPYHIRFVSDLKRSLDSSELKTMMPFNALLNLTEMLRLTLHLPGDVIEVGSWLGGSATAMAKRLIKSERQDKNLYMVDLFEQHEGDVAEGIMCLDEIKHKMAIYPNVHVCQGTIEENAERLDDKRFCFVHMDLGFREPILEFTFERMVPGAIMVIDNFLDIIGSRENFRKWFQKRGLDVSFTGHHVQGMVIKNN